MGIFKLRASGLPLSYRTTGPDENMVFVAGCLLQFIASLV